MPQQTAQELGSFLKVPGIQQTKMGQGDLTVLHKTAGTTLPFLWDYSSAHQSKEATTVQSPQLTSLTAPLTHTVGNWKLKCLGSPIHLAFILSLGLKPNFLWKTAH